MVVLVVIVTLILLFIGFAFQELLFILKSSLKSFLSFFDFPKNQTFHFQPVLKNSHIPQDALTFWNLILKAVQCTFHNPQQFVLSPSSYFDYEFINVIPLTIILFG